MSAIPALTAVLLAGCSSAAPMVKVEQMLEHCDAYKGKAVQAAGFLGQCAASTCFLAASKGRWRGYANAWNELHRAGADQTALNNILERIHKSMPISLGGSEAFDLKAKPLQYSYVVVTGRVASDSCTGEGGADAPLG